MYYGQRGRLLKRALVAALCSVCAYAFSVQAQEADGPGDIDMEKAHAEIEKATQILKQLSDRERQDSLFNPPVKVPVRKLPETTLREVERRVVEAVRKREAKKRLLWIERMQEIASSRVAVVQNCLGWLRVEDGRRKDVRTTRKCIDILGQIRAAEAAPILVGKIDMRLDKDEPASEKDVREKYPACDALVKIGKPGVHAAVEALKDEPPESEKARLCIFVVVGVEGVDVGRFVLQKAAQAETDPAKRANLQAVIKRLEQGDE